MTHAKTRIPKISMKQVNRLLEACVRPIPGDPSLLEVQPEKVPPLLLPLTLRALGATGKGASHKALQITRADWGIISSYLSQRAEEFVMDAESLALADQGPSALDLEHAILADPWVAGRNSSGDLCLIGMRPCGRGDRGRKPFSSSLTAIDVGQGWALSAPVWYRLGQRISGREFRELCPRYSNLQEYGDEEIESTLQAERASIASRTGQLKLSRG